MEPYLAQIIMFAGNFPPRGWAFCHGQLLSINSNQALFSLLGTMYGGDGRTTFGLPDLRGRAPVHTTSEMPQGTKVGVEEVSLSDGQIPQHNHPSPKIVSANAPDTDAASGAWIASNQEIFAEGGDNLHLKSQQTGSTGGGLTHTNMQPYLAINYIIALQGIFPSRS